MRPTGVQGTVLSKAELQWRRQLAHDHEESLAEGVRVDSQSVVGRYVNTFFPGQTFILRNNF